METDLRELFLKMTRNKVDRKTNGIKISSKKKIAPKNC